MILKAKFEEDKALYNYTMFQIMMEEEALKHLENAPGSNNLQKALNAQKKWQSVFEDNAVDPETTRRRRLVNDDLKKDPLLMGDNIPDRAASLKSLEEKYESQIKAAVQKADEAVMQMGGEGGKAAEPEVTEAYKAFIGHAESRR